jgi:hypothetical protein
MYSSRLSPLSVVSCIEMVSPVNPSLSFFSIYYTHPIIGKPYLILILDTTRLNHLLSFTFPAFLALTLSRSALCNLLLQQRTTDH